MAHCLRGGTSRPRPGGARSTSLFLRWLTQSRVLNSRPSSACTIQRWNGKRTGARPSWSMPAVEMTTRKTVSGETFRTSPVPLRSARMRPARAGAGALAKRCQVRLKRFLEAGVVGCDAHSYPAQPRAGVSIKLRNRLADVLQRDQRHADQALEIVGAPKRRRVDPPQGLGRMLRRCAKGLSERSDEKPGRIETGRYLHGRL